MLVRDSERNRRAHLVGIAGHGMRALADVLLGCGWRLSGSDLDIARVPAIAAAGVRLFQGHRAENLPPDADEVVYSGAVTADNPELQRAAELGIPTSSYFATLGRLGIGRRMMAVAGTHGKSTVTAMAAHVLTRAGRDPTVAYGASPLEAASGGRAGRSDLMLVEACEYRRNFLHLSPRHAAILNIEPDHFDCYDTLDELEDAFRQFAASLPPDGLLVARHDCISTRRVTAGLSCRIETFGLSRNADWSARIEECSSTENSRGPTARGESLEESLSTDNSPRAVGPRLFFAKTHFEILRFGKPFCRVRLQLPGEHNALNALAAAVLAHAEGLSPEEIATGLGDFPGLCRRLEYRGTWRGATWIDDYAHHPTEITAALTTVRRMFPSARLWCLFQPHQASRTRRLMDEFALSLRPADRVLIAEIFRAREGLPQPGDVTAADLAKQARSHGIEVLPGHTREEIASSLEAGLSPDDVLVTLGAGDVETYR